MTKNNQTNGSTAEKLAQQIATRTTASRKRKRMLYFFAGLTAILVTGYFIRQFKRLFSQPSSGITAPQRTEKLDTTQAKSVALTRLYELEEKNRRKDSLQIAEEEKALDYISMDWQNLYDVRKKMMKETSPQKEVAQADSTSNLINLLPRKESFPNQRTKREQTRVVSIANWKKRIIKDQISSTQATSANHVSSDLFNTVRAEATTMLSDGEREPLGLTAGTLLGKETTRNQANNIADGASVSVLAVVHGDYKVYTGTKVTFRTVEKTTLNGTLLPKNTLITAVAQVSGGRITFSHFRVQVGNRALVMPLHCYDSDMIAGISYQDQGILETEVRRNTLTTLSDAASTLSNTIPYGSLAQASAGIARGILRGSAKNRETFIYLADGYQVFLSTETIQ